MNLNRFCEAEDSMRFLSKPWFWDGWTWPRERASTWSARCWTRWPGTFIDLTGTRRRGAERNQGIRAATVFELEEAMERKTTRRGFPLCEFRDLYGAKCSIQKSSLATDDAIWLGIDDADPQILASKVVEGGTGWVKYPIPEDVLLTTRMHLNREQVFELLPILQRFVDTGEI